MDAGIGMREDEGAPTEGSDIGDNFGLAMARWGDDRGVPKGDEVGGVKHIARLRPLPK